jgi:hypothetical protein
MRDPPEPRGEGPLFPRWTNTALRVALVVGVTGAIATLTGFMVIVRSPLFTRQHEAVVQPIQFDHRHHVADVGIDCRYCHQTVETGRNAGYPATEICMSCHGQIWNKSPLLDRVRASYFSGAALSWKRVHLLPDYVYFNHAIHVNKGVGCATCHGRVDQMGAVAQEAPLSMEWCVDCHRDPISRLRPLDRITDLAWEPDDARAVGMKVSSALHVHTRTSCTTCHR